jgi:hypothetical protein
MPASLSPYRSASTLGYTVRNIPHGGQTATRIAQAVTTSGNQFHLITKHLIVSYCVYPDLVQPRSGVLGAISCPGSRPIERTTHFLTVYRLFPDMHVP